MCVVVYSGTLSSAWGAAPQQNTSGSNSERVSGARVITAKPERVTLSDGSGSTEIEWDTGNGSIGFVFVTEEGGKPVLFANGREVTRSLHGSENKLCFELYGDNQRQTLLAIVTVPGSAESTSSQQTVSYKCRPLGANRWVSGHFVLCSLSRFDRTGTHDISNRATSRLGSSMLHETFCSA